MLNPIILSYIQWASPCFKFIINIHKFFSYLRFETLINILAFALDINVTIEAVALVAANVVSALTVGLGITRVRHDLAFVDI